MRIQRFARAGVLAAAACFVMPAVSAVADETEGVDEIVVTARKREEALSEVPFSLAVQTGKQMERSGATNIEDISRSVAGFTVQNLGPGQSQVAIRGVSAGQIVRDQPGVKEQVGIYLDESAISLSLFTPDLDLFDLNRVEVLRGPQGTLFGSGSLSGTVRYITNQPDLEEFAASISAGAENVTDGEWGGNVKAMINVPLGDAAALRVAAYHSEIAGFIDGVNPLTGSTKDDVNGGHRSGFRASLRFEPNEDLTITPRIIYQDIEVDGFSRVDEFNILANQFTTTRMPVHLDDREQVIQREEQFSDEFFLFDVTIEQDVSDNLTLTSITSYTDREIVQIRDATALTASITAQPTITGLGPAVFTLDAPLDDSSNLRTFSQEFRASGSMDRFDWVAGVFYSDISRDYAQTLNVAGFTANSMIPSAFILAGTDILFYSNLEYEFEQLAVFGEGTYAITDALDLTVGVRWFDFDEDRELDFDGFFAVQTIGSEASTESDGFSPRAILAYQVNEDLQLNAQVSKGFRLGGVNDPLNAPLCSGTDLATFGGNPVFDDEELWNYEVGGHVTLADGRVQVGGAVYYQKIKDLQATLDAGSCSSRVILNVPDASVLGAEIEVSAQLHEYIDVAFSASYADSELDSTLRDSTGAILGGALKSGNRLPTVPEFQFSAALNFEKPIRDDLDMFATASYAYVGSRFTQIGDQAPGFDVVNMLTTPIGMPSPGAFSFNPELDSYGIGNVRVGVRSEGWEVALFVNNVTDENAELSRDRERGNRARVGYLTNQPRTIGFQATVDF